MITMRLNHARLATLSEWKPGSSDESIHCGKQVLALVANDENRLFALPRRKVMVVDQDYFTAVRRNNLTIERIIFGFSDGIELPDVELCVKLSEPVGRSDDNAIRRTTINVVFSRHA